MSRHSAHPFPRHARVSAQLQREIAAWIMQHLPAPWNTTITVTRVTVHKNISGATCYILGPEEHDEDELLEPLNAAVYGLQKYLGVNLRMKRIPKIEFKYDRQYEHTAKIEKILIGLDIPADEDQNENGELSQ